MYYSKSNTKVSINEVGGKGINLLRLTKLGLNVPDFLIIPSFVLEELLDLDEVASDNQNAIEKIDAYRFSESFLSEIESEFDGVNDKLFAVRSSSIQEDGKKHSFAGQYESYLYVSFNDIPKFIKEVWKSNFSDRVKTYFKTNELTQNYGIAVIIQEMVDADVSGVGFGIDPNTGDAETKVVCSVYGVGEGLVSGNLNSDTFMINSGDVTDILVEKKSKAVYAASGKIDYTLVTAELSSVASLNSNQLKQLDDTLTFLDKEFDGPQDIEFAYKDDELYLLQARPVTSVVKKSNKFKIVWDNSNIIESYPGVTTPLTFSYISEAYKNVYVQLAILMGASKKVVAKNEEVFAKMLGLIDGRVYYNLFSWYKVLSLFPGYKLNAEFMENMMGVKERFDLPKEKSHKFQALWRTMIMLTKILFQLFTIKKTTRRFYSEINQAISDVQASGIESMSIAELKESWTKLDERVTPKWKAPVVNDSFAMLYFGMLTKMVEKYQISENKNIQNDLLCGSSDIISVEPIHRSIELSTLIQGDEVSKELFLNNTPLDIWENLPDSDVKDKIDAYLSDFGDRCIGELKLETVSYKQDPTLFIAQLKSLVEQSVTKKNTSSNVDKELRLKAEEEVNSALKAKFFKKRRFNRVLKRTRYFVSNRENLRYQRTRIFGVTREHFNLIGIRMHEAGLLEDSRDVFYLTKNEIFDFVDGSAVAKNLKGLVALRKDEYTEYKSQDAPNERITTYETVNTGNDFYAYTPLNFKENELAGLGCCPGKVKAKVRVVKDPSELKSLNGDILVTSSTDPGWVTLFPTASAIVVERGSLLSHSAIVSREMGIPCIVGVSGLLKTLKTGDLIEMDGSTGVIKIIKDEE